MPDGEPSPKKWTECSYCGHWFAQALPTCPQCKKPNDGNGPDLVDPTPVDAERAALISVGIVVRILLFAAVILVLTSFLPLSNMGKLVTYLVVIAAGYVLRRIQLHIFREMGLIVDKSDERNLDD